MAPKINSSLIQSKAFWAAVLCIGFKLWLKTDDAKDTFGTLLQVAKQVNAGSLWVFALVAGKRFFDLAANIKKLPENFSDLAENKENDKGD